MYLKLLQVASAPLKLGAPIKHSFKWIGRVNIFIYYLYPCPPTML